MVKMVGQPLAFRELPVEWGEVGVEKTRGSQSLVKCPVVTASEEWALSGCREW